MDINNDTETIEQNIRLLKQSKFEFGDVSHQMVKMIQTASATLEGSQMEKAKQTTFESVSKIKNTIVTIDRAIDYLNELKALLDEYLSCKFTEV